jgi:hypothetical protein
MDSARPLPPEESAALDQLERAEAAVRAAPTPRVLWRARVMLERLLRAREFEQAGRDFGAVVDRHHAAAAEHGELSDEEIEAEIQAARSERATRR